MSGRGRDGHAAPAPGTGHLTPAELAILLARIGSLLRRSNWARQRAPKEARPEPQHDRFTFNGKTIDFDTLELTVGDRVHHAFFSRRTPLNFFLLFFTSMNSPVVLSRFVHAVLPSNLPLSCDAEYGLRLERRLCSRVIEN